MTLTRKPPLSTKKVSGLKYFKQLKPLLARLHDSGTESDRSGNRRQQGLRIAIRNRQHWNLCNHRNIFQVQAFRVFRRADTRR